MPTPTNQQPETRLFGISVVVPCFNGAAFVGQAIESVISQGHPCGLEILVGDDGSTDESANIAARYGDLVRILHHPGRKNRGLPATRNLCISEAKFPLLAFLDCDDLFLDGHLCRAFTFLSARPEIAFYAEAGTMINTAGEHIGPKAHSHPGGLIRPEDLLVDQWFPPVAVVVRREAVISAGRFAEDMKSAEDQDMWLRILERYPGFFSTDVGYAYRLHEAQMTTDPRLWDWAEESLRRAVLRHPYPSNVIRKRKAVIAYRRALSARAAGRMTDYASYLGRAFLLDPVRGTRELASRICFRFRAPVKDR